MVATALQPNLPGTSSTSTTTSTANAAQPSTLAALGTQPTAAEQQRTSDLQEQFQQQAQKDPAGFRSAMRAAFGDKASLAQIDQLLDLALSGKLPLPSNIQFVEAGSLGSGALGAYDASNSGSLYLDRSLLSDPAKLQSVFNEEMGHHLDALLGGSDAAGDEGAVFSRTLELGTLSQFELTALKSENDHGVIQIGSRWVQVEFRQEGADDSGGGGGDSGGGDSGGSESSSSGGADSSGGSSSDGGSGAGGSTDSGSGGECGAHSDGDASSGSGESESPSGNNGGHQNGESDSDRAGGAQGNNSTGGQSGGNGASGADGTSGGGDSSEGANSATTGDDEDTPSESASGTTPDEEGSERAPESEPEEKGFWSSALDKAAELAASGLSFVTNNTPLPDLTPAEAMEFLAEDQDGVDQVSQVTADDGVVTTIGSYEYDYETPDASLENKTFSAGFKADIDGTAYTVETKRQIGPVEIEGTRKMGTANANAGLEVSAGLDGSKLKANIEASAGAEVMGIDVRAEGSVNFTVQDLFDKGADVYNATVDPVHESIVGHDVPDMDAYDVPEAFDREITISGHVDAGLGASVKGSFGANVGKTGDRSDGVAGGHFAGKLGYGPVVGVGASIVID